MIRRFYHILVLLSALTLMGVQGFALSHSVSCGSEPHDHDGIACVLDQAQIEHKLLLPETGPAFAEFFPVETIKEPISSKSPDYIFKSRAPPSRGPPSLSI